jgi:hypothetical protein
MDVIQDSSRLLWGLGWPRRRLKRENGLSLLAKEVYRTSQNQSKVNVDTIGMLRQPRASEGRWPFL